MATRPFDTAKIWIWALAGGAGGGVVNLALYFLTHAAGVEFIGKFQGPEGPTAPLMVPLVMVSSVIPALAGALVLTVLNLVTRRPGAAFAVVSALFLALSMWGPLTVNDASAGTKIVLALMHIVAASGILAGIYMKARSP